MSLLEALHFCATPNGIALVVGVLLSLVAEYVPPYQNLESKWKRLVMAAASLFLPLAALLLGFLLYEQPFTPDTIWAALVAGGAAFTSSQIAHLRTLGGEDGNKRV